MRKPIYIKTNRLINQPIEKVWSEVALGFGNVANYNPEIKASKFETDQKEGIGTQRHCDTKDGGYLKERIIAWESQKFFKLELVSSSYPMSLIESKFSFERHDSQTMVVQEFWYRMKPPMGWLSGLMKGKMTKTLNSGLEGLENYMLNNEKEN